MELVDKRGKKRERDARGFRKYYGKEKKSVIFFTAPKNIEGTAFGHAAVAFRLVRVLFQKQQVPSAFLED